MRAAPSAAKPTGRLMAQREIRQDVAFFDDLEQRQHKIAGNAENLVGAVVLQRLEQSMGKRRHGNLPEFTRQSGQLAVREGAQG